MAIDINGISSSQSGIKTNGSDDAKLNKPADQAVPQQDQSQKSSVSDTVSLSDGAVQLGKLEPTSISAPVVDTQRVEQVKQALADGSYRVDPEKIADKLMQFESMLKPKG